MKMIIGYSLLICATAMAGEKWSAMETRAIWERPSMGLTLHTRAISNFKLQIPNKFQRGKGSKSQTIAKMQEQVRREFEISHPEISNFKLQIPSKLQRGKGSKFQTMAKMQGSGCLGFK